MERFHRELDADIFKRPRDALRVSIPAICYVIQNNLLFFAISKLDAATYQVTYQLKILTTAFCAVVMLKRSLGMLKWVALVMLTIGVALVQVRFQLKFFPGKAIYALILASEGFEKRGSC